MASGIYERLKFNLMSKIVDLVNDTIKVLLLNNTHTFTSTHNVLSDVSANEISGTGYISGGTALANKTVTQASSAKFDADDVSWNSATFTAYHAVLNNVTASNNLICSIDFGGPITITSGTFTLVWDSAGIITLN